MLNPKKVKLKARQPENSVLFDLAQDYLDELLNLSLNLKVQKYPLTGPNDLEVLVDISDKTDLHHASEVDQFIEDMVSTYTKRMGGHGCRFIECQSDMGRHYTNDRRTPTYIIVNGSDPIFLLVEQTPENQRIFRIRVVQLSSYIRQVFNQTSNEVANKHNLESFAFRTSLYLEVFIDTTKRCLDAIFNKPKHNMDIRCTINRNYMRYVRESTQWNEERVKIRKRLTIEGK